MILVDRGIEPDVLRKVRLTELPKLMRIARPHLPKGEDILGYRVVARDLWRAHRFKCCYCERRIIASHNDVKHYRPKVSADRSPGSNAKHGYWWLAFTWANLVFACPTCNRSKKNDKFPLAHGSVALAPCEVPPGKENPLLLDPAVDHGVEHIEFVFSIMPRRMPGIGTPPGWDARKHWWPRARGGSQKGDFTIRVCGLDAADQVELYDDHVNKEIRRIAGELVAAIEERSSDVPVRFERAHRLIEPGMPFVGLSYDALRHLVPDSTLALCKLAWPAPRQVGRPPPVPRRRARRRGVRCR